MGKTIFEMSPDGGTTKYNVRDNNIAPIELDATSASQPYEVGEQFVLDSDGLLYEATSTISQGSAIVVYPTAGYNCKLSKSVTEQIADRVTYGDSLNYADKIVGWTGKNRLKVETKTSHGVTYSVNNGVITVNDTSDSSNTNYTTLFDVPDGEYIFHVGNIPTNSNYSFTIFKISSGTSSGELASIGNTSTDNVRFTVDHDGYDQLQFRIWGRKETAFNYTLSPMVCEASLFDADPTFEPYHDSVDECKADNSVIGNVEDGANASQTYTAGSYFQRNGKLGKAINDGISNGGSFNLGTNYIETTVAAELKALADAIAAI